MCKYNLKNIKGDNKVKYCSYLGSEKLCKLIEKCGKDVEIHANVKTIISQYLNEDIGVSEYENLDLLYKYENKAPILADILNGYYDLEGRVFWLNSKESVKIVIDNDVDYDYTVLIKENEVVGFCFKGNRFDENYRC